MMTGVKTRRVDDYKLSKALSYHLRHAPEEIGLQLQPGGWVGVEELLAGLAGRGIRVTAEDLARVTRDSDKQRFALEDGRIRASQGHSVEVDLELSPQQPPDVLYHGTPEKSVPSILHQGLLKGSRHHVHLSALVDTARQVGGRRGRPVVLRVHAGRMHAEGYVFYCSANGVWLTETVPVRFLEQP